MTSTKKFLLLLAIGGMAMWATNVEAATIGYRIADGISNIPNPHDNYDSEPDYPGVQAFPAGQNNANAYAANDSEKPQHAVIIDGQSGLKFLRKEENFIRRQGTVNGTNGVKADDVVAAGFTLSMKAAVPKSLDGNGDPMATGDMWAFVGRSDYNGGTFEFSGGATANVWRIMLGTDSNGDAIVTVPGYERANNFEHSVGDAGWHTYDLHVAPGGESMQLSVDGVDVSGNLTSIAWGHDANTWRIGDCCGGAPDVEFVIQWAEVNMIPEPASCVLVSMAFAAIGLVVRRRSV